MINFSKTTLLSILLTIFIIAAGFFAYQWWQIKGELAKQIGQNENLTRQIDELQKEIEELKVSEEEIAEQKTYRNEEYGFEIDYPTVGWEFRNGEICRVSTFETQENKEEFCIDIGIAHLRPACVDESWEEIFSSLGAEYGGKECIIGHIWGGEFEKEIITNFEVKGYKGELTRPISLTCVSRRVVYFLLKGEVKLRERSALPLLAISYFDCPEDFDFGEEEIEIFEKVVSSVRFIEK